MGEEETKYYSKDFKWEELREDIEKDCSLAHHIIPFAPSASRSSSPCDSEAWKNFHNRHFTGRFFKERRYLLKEFPELVHCDENCKLLEVGCGNGSTVLPILRGNQSIMVYACDCSSEALERANEMIDTAEEASIKHRFHPFVCDFAQSVFPNWLVCNVCRKSSRNKSVECTSDVKGNKEEDLNGTSSSKQAHCCTGGMHFITLIFTLSAVPFQKMPEAIAECFSVLRPGGFLLFRDYGKPPKHDDFIASPGLYDMTMLRFQPNKRIGFREYLRSDGTRSYFFCLDTTRKLFVDAGFVELELEYCCVKSVNRRNGKIMQRVWVHGKFQKPV